MKERMATFTVHTDLVFDSERKTFVKDISINVDPNTGLIIKVYQREDTLPSKLKESDIDLRGKCVLPGLVDAHTHIFLHPYAETPSLHQERDESLIERTIRATNHCRAALMAGYTTYRDLGTESAQDADVHVRNAVNRGIIPGPRMYCVTEALASSGGYDIRIENRIGGTITPRLSDPCDGIVGVRAGVRRRLGAGADLIKFYADYRKRALRFPERAWPGCPEIIFPPSGDNLLDNARSPNCLLFNQEEMDEIVREATASKAPVAAHAQSPEAVLMAVRAGVTTIEHGFEPWGDLEDEIIQAMLKHGTIFVPTLAVLDLVFPVDGIAKQVKRAHERGVKIACGGDTGAFAHGDNVRELELLIETGIPLEDVLVGATALGWQACGGGWCGRRFGRIGEGCAADIVALDGNLREDVGALRKVDFVMKDGRVWQRDGQPVGMS